jgi:hypothetical protein
MHTQLPIINLINSCCKALFPAGAGTTSSGGTEPAWPFDRHACATYLYYM